MTWGRAHLCLEAAESDCAFDQQNPGLKSKPHYQPCACCKHRWSVHALLLHSWSVCFLTELPLEQQFVMVQVHLTSKSKGRGPS